MTLLAAVHAGQLLEVLVVSLVAGLAVTVIFSCVVSTAIRSGEARRAGHDGTATVYLVAAVACFAAFAALVVFAVETLLAK